MASDGTGFTVQVKGVGLHHGFIEVYHRDDVVVFQYEGRDLRSFHFGNAILRCGEFVFELSHVGSVGSLDYPFFSKVKWKIAKLCNRRIRPRRFTHSKRRLCT